MRHARQCVECGRHFDLDLLHDAEEWAYGHNCEPARTIVEAATKPEPNYADQRAMALKAIPDTLIMERKSYGWTFRIGWEFATPFSMWYDPGDDILSIDMREV